MKERWEKGMNLVGLSLLALCFVFALLKVFSREAKVNSEESIRITFAHWQLEGGLRETFDVIARRYEDIQLEKAIVEARATLGWMSSTDVNRPALEDRLDRMEAGELKPVIVEQVPVPEKVFEAWLKTRLVGHVAPHLITLKSWTNDSMVATYFSSLGDSIEEVNAYNDGTPLEGLRWRDTFVDGLRHSGYKPNLMDYYTIPCTVLTIRMFYNQDLVNEVLAEPENTDLEARVRAAGGFPDTYADFIGLCEAIQAYGEGRGTRISPISGSRYNVPIFMNQLFYSQTQKLRLERDYLGDHSYIELLSALDYLNGEWDYSHPALQSALKLSREIGGYMKPGFLQMNRDDAVFDFVQGRAAMITSGAWDAPSLELQAGGLFEIGVAPIPIPTPAEPGYGEFVYGPLTEAQTQPAVNFGLVQHHPEEEKAVALDFLRYLTSFEGAKLFTDGSGWLPATVEVEPMEAYKVFEPVLEGYPPGYFYSLKDNGETNRVIDASLHNLLKADGSVDAFVEAIEEPLQEAMLYALNRQRRDQEKMLERQDVQMGVYKLSKEQLSEQAEEMQERFLLLLDSQHLVEAQQLHLGCELDAL